jgi:hypothetical protein
VWVVESNLDNMNPELVPPLFDALFAAGALDVWSSPITMKKGRLGQMVSAMVAEDARPAVQEAFFRHASTLGVRFRRMERAVLPRRRLEVATPFGVVGVKVGGLDGEPISAQPELEDCRRCAEAAEVPVRQVWTAAFAAAQGALRSPEEVRGLHTFPSQAASRQAKAGTRRSAAAKIGTKTRTKTGATTGAKTAAKTGATTKAFMGTPKGVATGANNERNTAGKRTRARNAKPRAGSLPRRSSS